MIATWEDLWPSDEDPLDGVVITDVEEESERPKQRRSTNIKRKHQANYRRAFSETQLLDICDLPFQEGNSYHFITGGDVDALSYLKIVLRQQNLGYCLFSTWCMANDKKLYEFYKDYFDNIISFDK